MADIFCHIYCFILLKIKKNFFLCLILLRINTKSDLELVIFIYPLFLKKIGFDNKK